MTRERLLAAVWGYGFAGETRTVDILCSSCAKSSGCRGADHHPKLGYRLER